MYQDLLEMERKLDWTMMSVRHLNNGREQPTEKKSSTTSNLNVTVFKFYDSDASDGHGSLVHCTLAPSHGIEFIHTHE
jgi:hypothetical protein